MKSERIEIRVHPATKSRLERIATSRYTVSAIIRDAIDRYLNERDVEELIENGTLVPNLETGELEPNVIHGIILPD